MATVGHHARWRRLATLRELAAMVMRGANGDDVVLGPARCLTST
jgi:hypothetical protein